MQICPDCIEPLIKDSKKLAMCTHWMICPKCGHRERPDKDVIDFRKVGSFIDRIRKSNRNENQFNKD